MTRPAYRYLEAPMPATPAAISRGIRIGLALVLPLWLLIFAAGFTAAQLFTP